MSFYITLHRCNKYALVITQTPICTYIFSFLFPYYDDSSKKENDIFQTTIDFLSYSSSPTTPGLQQVSFPLSEASFCFYNCQLHHYHFSSHQTWRHRTDSRYVQYLVVQVYNMSRSFVVFALVVFNIPSRSLTYVGHREPILLYNNEILKKVRIQSSILFGGDTTLSPNIREPTRSSASATKARNTKRCNGLMASMSSADNALFALSTTTRIEQTYNACWKKWIKIIVIASKEVEKQDRKLLWKKSCSR